MTNVFETDSLVFKDFIRYDDLKIPSGLCCFITGPSGSGKSTLLKLFNQSESASSGTILYNGMNIEDIDAIKLRREVLLCNQTPFLFDASIRENFKLFHESRDSKIDEKKIDKYLNICCIEFDLDKSCVNLSGGERARVYLAICLSFMPKVLMLDEPTSALDTQNSDIVIGNIIDFCKSNNMTLIVVSHDKGLAKKYEQKLIRIGGKNE